jgi:hypothetical protein
MSKRTRLRMRVALLAGVALAAFAAPARATEAPWGDGIEVMDETELEEHRGGFEIGGLQINFGAAVTTLVNGVPALTTQLTWTDTGAFVAQTVGNVGEDLADMSPDQLAALGLEGLENAGGVVIADEAGVTALVHNVTEGALQNIIINSATGRDLTQDVDVTLELPGFDLIQQSLIVESFGIHLTDDMRGVMFYDPGG